MMPNVVYLLVSHSKVGNSMFVEQIAFSLTTEEDYLEFKESLSHVLYVATKED